MSKAGGRAEQSMGAETAPRFPFAVSPERCRVPAALAAAAVALGIVADRSVNVPPALSITVGFLASAFAICSVSRQGRSTALLILALASVGAIRHHLIWTSRLPNDISQAPLRDNAPVQLTGVIRTPIEIRRAEWSAGHPCGCCSTVRHSRLTSSSCTDGDVPVSGRIQVDVSGHVLGMSAGDRVVLIGRLRTPEEPRTPDAFDSRSWLRAQGIDRTLSVEHPEAVTRLGDASTWMHRIASLRHACRSECERFLNASLSDGVSAGELRCCWEPGLPDGRDPRAFIRSGTMHLLAISGLHVGILAALVVVACRLLEVRPGWTAIVLIVTWPRMDL